MIVLQVPKESTAKSTLSTSAIAILADIRMQLAKTNLETTPVTVRLKDQERIARYLIGTHLVVWEGPGKRRISASFMKL